MLKCYTTAEMVKIITKYSDINTALDIINESKKGNSVKLVVEKNGIKLKT